ncbi:MAG TPA: pitrilysin family protein, partial [Saprospiraceae bacterium]|nr:pitrilysin family protein [Saprospiraceae bacterium]
MNRKIAPPTHQVRGLSLPTPQRLHLDNGISVYVLDYPDQEILKIEAVYRAGRPYERQRLASRSTARMLREGSSSRSGADIAEHLDFYGASLSIPTNLDSANFLLFSLKKYASEVIPVYAELLQEPVFPEVELETSRRNSLQELQVDLEKVDIVAYRKVTELIFGENHAYGYNSTAADYLAIQREHLVEHHRRCYTPENCSLFVSGRADEQVLQLLNRHLGQRPASPGASPLSPKLGESSTARPGKVSIAMPNSLQSGIRVGRRLFSRKHPDFNGVFVLNTILGGYFGSRLMANIREKKGFTYNIYSTADAMFDDGCLYISTEVNADKSAATLRAIFSEMKKLREKPVSEEELDMVRN